MDDLGQAYVDVQFVMRNIAASFFLHRTTFLTSEGLRKSLQLEPCRDTLLALAKHIEVNRLRG